MLQLVLKNIDISNTFTVLKRATLGSRVGGGQIASDIVDVYLIHQTKHRFPLNIIT
jgi:hypothetical protein